jgi:hypothetical protein
VNFDQASKQRRQGAVFSYEVAIRELRIGELALRIEALADFSRAIDEMFEFLQRTNSGQFLTQYCPYFGDIWPSAVGLSEYLLKQQRDWRSMSVLELGCVWAGAAVDRSLQVRGVADSQ